MLPILRRYLFALVLFAGSFHAAAFSLLGPYAPWMTPQIGYQWPGDIGGPMNIGEGYRWNVPVVTYAYDPSFISYFGSNGVAEVEKAVQVLNNLPPASLMDLNAYPLASMGVNGTAQTLGFMDLKSEALSLLVQEMGLASPTRWIFCLRDRFVSNGQTNYVVIQRNFDPAAFTPDIYINDELYTYGIYEFPPRGAVAEAVPTDPSTVVNLSVASGILSFGTYFNGLTRDDAGGLRYLLSRNNACVENLLPGVHGIGTNAEHYVNIAIRPGVEKVTFRQVDYNSVVLEGNAITNQYVDTYIANGVPAQQTLERVTARPDIIFSAADLGLTSGQYPILTSESSATNWVNNSLFNSSVTGAGPGVIQPGIVIAFSTLGPYGMNSTPAFLDSTTAAIGPTWASFAAPSNTFGLYPAPLTIPASPSLRVKIDTINNVPQFNWLFWANQGHTYRIEASTNLADWFPFTTITNNSGIIQVLSPVSGNNGINFYRAIEESAGQ